MEFFGKFLWTIPAIISTIALIISLMIKGYVPPLFGGLSLLGLIIFILIGSTLGRLISIVIRVLLPFISLILLTIIWGGGDIFFSSEFFVMLFILCIMCFGIYAMFFGGFQVFGKRIDKHWYNVNFGYDFIVIISAVVLILGLIVQGLISYYYGIIILVLIVFFLALGRGFGGRTSHLVRILFRYGLPLVSLLTLFSMNFAHLSI